MKIAIIAAMPQEIAYLQRHLIEQTMLSVAQLPFYKGVIAGIEIILLQSGIGKAAAAMTTALLLDRYTPDLVINTGVAGKAAAQLKISDLILADRICYHDVDITAFGYQYGQMASCPTYFTTDHKMNLLAMQCAQENQFLLHRGLICSGDAFICGQDLKRIKHQFPDVMAVEMEAAAIAQICHRFSTPFIMLRTISDGADSSAPALFDQFLEQAVQQFTRFTLLFLQRVSTHYALSSSL